MRWKISHHGHDPRLNDLLAILALLLLSFAAWHYFGARPRTVKPGGLHRPQSKRTLVKSGF